MSPDFDPVFRALRDIMLKHADGLAVARDGPGELIVHTLARDGKGRPEWFGAVTIKRSYVAYHLPPLHARPALGDGLSDELVRRRQGKTCFNFKRVEPVLFDQLDRLTDRVRQAV